MMKQSCRLFATTILVCGALASCTNNVDIPVVPEPEYTPILTGSNESSAELTQLSMSQCYNMVDSFEVRNLRGKENKVSIYGKGYYEVVYTIYPLFALSESPSPGDYYLVDAEVRVQSQDMYNTYSSYYTLTSEYGEVKCSYNLWGYYLKGIKLVSKLIDKAGKEVAVFPTEALPTPSTTMSSTTYTSGFQWGLKGKLRIETNSETGIMVKGRILPFINFINKQHRNTALIDVLNNSSDKRADVAFNYNEPNPDVVEPPMECITSKTFHESWIWYVPTTKDFGEDQFRMRFNCQLFYADHWGDDAYGLGFTETITTIQSDSIDFDVTPPVRNPMGQLTLQNTSKDQYITDIVICKHNTSDTITTSGQNSYAPDASFCTNLDEGDYDISFKMGKTPDAMNRYVLSLDKASVLRNKNVTLYSDFHFEEE